MIAYASRTGTRRNLKALRDRGWRLMVSAKGVLRHEGFPYALDNGAWWAHCAGVDFDEAAFARAVDRLGDGADWIVAPDVVAGGLRSLEFSLRWIERLRPLPLMLAVQDGMSIKDVRQHVGATVGIFVGGTTEWKLATVGAWAELGREVGAWVHVGRVNSITRLRLCAEHAVTSFDGSSASRFAKTTGKLDNARRSPDLFAPTAARPTDRPSGS